MRWVVKRERLYLFPPGVSPKIGAYVVNADLVIQGVPQQFTDANGVQHTAQVLVKWTDEELEKIGVYPDRTERQRKT